MDFLDNLLLKFERDDELDEVLLNGSSALIEVKGTDSRAHSSPFTDQNQLEREIQEFAFSQGVRLDPLKPWGGGLIQKPNLPLQFRWNALLRAVSPFGPLLSVRRHRFEQLGLSSFGGWCSRYRGQLLQAMIDQCPILVFGQTGSGKTSFMSSLLYEFSAHERVVILEQYTEILPLSRSWVNLSPLNLGKNGQDVMPFLSLFAEILRMRPDRIVIGEARGQEEGLALLEAMVVGHGGVICSIHIDSLQHSRSRLMQLIGSRYEEVLKERNPLMVMLSRGDPPQVSGIRFYNDQPLTQ